MPVSEFLDAAEKINDTTLSAAIGGMAVILLVWSAVFGLKNDWNFRGFRWPLALVVPFLMFLAGYLLIQVQYSMSVAGYRWETLRERWRDGDGEYHAITDPRAHFTDQYAGDIQFGAGLALFSVTGGVVLLSAWFIVNVARQALRASRGGGKDE